MSEKVEITKIPVPRYYKGPVIVNTATKYVGEPIEITGCKFSSVIRLNDTNVYWLKDGFQQIKASLSTYYDVDGGSSDISINEISRLSYDTSDYRMQGYYQCVIDVPGYLEKPLISQKVNVQFQDISDTRVTLNKDRTYNSREYVELKTKVETQIKESLKIKDGDTPVNRIVEVSIFTEDSINVVARILYTRVSNKLRLSNCKELPKLLTRDRFTGIGVQSVKVDCLDCCQKSTTGEDSYKGEYTFNETLVQHNVTSPCRYQNSARNYRQCIPDLQNGPKWSKINLEACPTKTKTTQELLELSKVKVCNRITTTACSNASQVAAQLAAILYDGSVITTQHDILFTSNIIDHLVTNIDTNMTSLPTDIIENILNSTNNILFADTDIIAKAQRNSKSASNILQNLDRFAMKMGQILKKDGRSSYHTGRSRMAFIVGFVPKANFTVYSRLKKKGEYNVVIVNETNHASAKQMNALSAIDIPEEAFKSEKEIIYSYSFENDVMFMQNNKLFNPRKNEIRIVQSSILSATLSDKPVENLTKPIMIRFKRTRNINRKGNNTCGFWQFIGFGQWNNSGCRKLRELDNGDVVCSCNHLTNFALLFDVSQSANNPLALQIITWIGCGISIAGLALTILTYILFKNLRKNLAPKILLCLCISLIALLVTFLAGIEATDPHKGCQTVAALLQYFMLTTFCWMAVEGVNLYKCFVKVFKSGREDRFMLKASIFAWGVPVVIVAITAGVEPGNLGNDSFCVVRGYSFYFGILLPVSIILLFNIVVLILVMRGLSKDSLTKSNKKAQDVLTQTRIAFMCAMLLGSTWLFGIFAVQKVTTVFQWLFCIFNSLQGFFIFVFNTVRNQDARKEWMRCVGLDRQEGNPSSENKNVLLRTKMRYQLSKGTKKWIYSKTYDEDTIGTSSGML